MERRGSVAPRAILHVDMDMFFVAVELRRRPDLRGRPVVVGGDGRRGVVAAASYEARRHGVHSAMPSVTARRRCPEAVFLPGDMAAYQRASDEVFAVFHDVTPLVEGLSLDEAFLDVTGARALLGSPVEIAHAVRRRIADELSLPSSVGVATNKFVAKLASQAAKPTATAGGVHPGPGVLDVPAGTEREFVAPLPIEALWGVGPATHERLVRVGVRQVSDLLAIDPRAVRAAVGEAVGSQLLALAAGLDDRPVVSDREPKSIGHEETFGVDVREASALRTTLVAQCDAVTRRLRAGGQAARTLTLKVRFADFSAITRSRTPGVPMTASPTALAIALELLSGVDVSRGVRTLGVSLSGFVEPDRQPSLFHSGDGVDDLERTWAPAASTVDEIRARFGDGAIGPASTVGRHRRPGASPWGPSRDPSDE